MIAYASRTGNIRTILNKINAPSANIAVHTAMNEPFLLFTYTDGIGQVPAAVNQFMTENWQYCKGIIVSGNRNFGHDVFGRAGDILAKRYDVPLVRKLDLQGGKADYEAIEQFYAERVAICKHTSN